MVGKVSKLEVYQMLIGTHKNYHNEQLYASKIAEILGVSREYIRRIVNELETAGYIIYDTTKTNKNYYSATEKYYDGKKPIDTNGYIQTESGRRPCYCVQKSRYEVIIEKDCLEFFNDKKNWMWGNCLCYKYTHKVYNNLDEFEFIKVGKEKLIIIIPSIYFKKDELPTANNTLFKISYEALKWFVKESKMKIDFTSLHQCQKPHIGVPSASSWAKRVAKDWSLNIDGKMLDCSSGNADWELVFDDDVLDAVEGLESLDEVPSIKSELDGLKTRMDNIEYYILPVLKKSIDQNLSETSYIKNILNPELKPEDGYDPAFA